MIRRGIGVALGVVLIVLGFVGWHVELGAILVGSVAVGLISGDWILEVVETARGGRRRRNGNGSSSSS